MIFIAIYLHGYHKTKFRLAALAWDLANLPISWAISQVFKGEAIANDNDYLPESECSSNGDIYEIERMIMKVRPALELERLACLPLPTCYRAFQTTLFQLL